MLGLRILRYLQFTIYTPIWLFLLGTHLSPPVSELIHELEEAAIAAPDAEEEGGDEEDVRVTGLTHADTIASYPRVVTHGQVPPSTSPSNTTGRRPSSSPTFRALIRRPHKSSSKITKTGKVNITDLHYFFDVLFY